MVKSTFLFSWQMFAFGTLLRGTATVLRITLFLNHLISVSSICSWIYIIFHAIYQSKFVWFLQQWQQEDSLSVPRTPGCCKRFNNIYGWWSSCIMWRWLHVSQLLISLSLSSRQRCSSVHWVSICVKLLYIISSSHTYYALTYSQELTVGMIGGVIDNK
jgi:hypothetical protein